MEEGMKNDTRLTVWVDEDMADEISRLAALEHRSPSEYVRAVMSRHVYGHRARSIPKTEAASRRD